MRKYIVYGQTFNFYDEKSHVVKIDEYDSYEKAKEKLAYVRKSNYYEYEWIEEG